jgi:hypothetical protein
VLPSESGQIGGAFFLASGKSIIVTKLEHVLQFLRLNLHKPSAPMNGHTPEPVPPTPSDVEIILDEQPIGDGFRVTRQAFRLQGGTLIPVGPRLESWRSASPREREDWIDNR